ncbi:hypothetical protein FRC01_010419, partial [Tulasnella sp. 417]
MFPSIKCLSTDSGNEFLTFLRVRPSKDKDTLAFRGDTSQEAEEFIHEVNIRAFKTGKLKDQEWITTFASVSFAGKALRWYRRLPRQTRQDWELLQEAILEKDWNNDENSSLG